MTKSEILSKLLIKPKKLTVKGGFYKHNAKAEIYTNADADMTYLLGLANFDAKPEKVWYG